MGGENLYEGDELEGDDFARPFLGMSFDPLSAPAHADDEAETEHAPRAYLLTGGRTGGGRANVAMETVVVVEDDDLQVSTLGLSAEMERIYRASAEPLAVAEIAATVGLPLGVTQVLVGDMVHDNLLARSEETISIHDDVAFIERLILGVTAL